MHELTANDSRKNDLHQWLRDVLAEPDIQITPASEDASFRRYFRVRAGTRTWIAMDAPPPMEDCRPFIAVSRLLRNAGVNAPAVHGADIDRGFLLLDDLGTTCYLDRLETDDADTLYGDAFEALLGMQCRIVGDTVPRYDTARLGEEVALFPAWLLARHLELTIDPACSVALADAFDALIAVCLEQPAVFVHRDYHSRNLMVCPGGNPGVIDFQDAVRGPITYDLVSLLRDVYIRWPASRVDAWVDDYHDRALERGLLREPDRSGFRRWFDLTGVQRHLKIAGIFARLWHRDGKARYLDDIPLAIAYVAEVAPRYPESAPIARIIESLGVESAVHAARAAIDSSHSRGQDS